MLSHVAVDQIVPGALLAASAAAFIDGTVGFRGANRLGIDAFGDLRGEWRMLVQAHVEVDLLGTGLPLPADRPAVYVMDVENLRPAVDDALFDRVTEVAARHRCSRIAKC